MMAGWIPQYSTVISRILDIPVGTQEVIDTRHDYCKILDSAYSIVLKRNRFYTGSKSEGLTLVGSDDDYMTEINIDYNLVVIQSCDENTSSSPHSTFLMSTENVRPGFALLQHVPQTPLTPFLNQASQNMNGSRFLVSDLFMQNRLMETQRVLRDISMNGFLTMRRQGPSKEIASHRCPNIEPEDHVDCIHCAFWPKNALEWRVRPRNFGWPKQDDVLSITNFGFHLVAVGHPHSETKLMEWRISFSIAERILVWSFNHIQIQCYAFMKIILKLFIKARCNPENQILCSYFIKTFLFWKYETTDVNFWREDNFRECMKYLLLEFSKCIRDGMLRHYFIPEFNLLSVKLTPAAQHELLQLFDIIIESDISILKDCGYLKMYWSMFLFLSDYGNELIELHLSVLSNQTKFRIDSLMWHYFDLLNFHVDYALRIDPMSLSKVFGQIISLDCKTPLQDFILRSLLLNRHIKSAMHTLSSRNKYVYQLKESARIENVFLWHFNA